MKDKRSAEPPAARRFGLQARIVLTFGLIVVGLVGVSLVYVVRNQSESLLDQTREKGFALAHSIAWLSTSSLLSYNYVALNQAANRSGSGAEATYVVIYDKEGQIAADSRERNSFGHPPRERADVKAAETREDRWMIVPAARQGEAPVIEFLVPVYVEDRAVKWGTVRVGISLAEVNADIQRTTHHLVLAGLVAAILCLIGARFAAHAITRPIERLVVATRAVARGDYSQRLDLRSGDELETLAWHFDRMADEVQKQQAEILSSREDLRRLNENLEVTVESRTHALAESEGKYRILVESSPLGILIVQSGTAVFVNKAFERMTGREASTMLLAGTDPFCVFDPESEHRIRKAVLEDAGAQVEGQICQPSGKQIFVEVHTASLLFQNAPATMILASDVSAQRDLQERLIRGEKLRALGELAAGVAHDFNNNLGIILGRTQLLQMKVSDPEVTSGLEIIRQAAMDGGQTVRRIQQYTRVREELQHEVLHLPSVAAEVIEITKGKWKNEAERRGVKIEIRIEASEPSPIRGTRAEIREALTNLIFNAVDALPMGGSVVIRARASGPDSILEVEDNGIGMAEQVKSRMFEPFFTTKGLSGNGLGLSMVYGIVSRHRGSIEVESKEQVGTVVRMKFPSVDPTKGDLAGPTRHPAPFQARVLVVDDEIDLVSVMRDTLRREGHEVVTATGGNEGIERFRAGKFDAVLTDLGMPDVSGWEVARIVRTEGGPRIVLGLVTGWGATVSEEVMVAHGIDFVISKPFEVATLASKVNETLATRVPKPRRSASQTGSRRT
ncbi:MAG TPA: ATP-binding protein [Candidatus Limnocylindrales bacterium]|nr:ATP-binding protein [Candidatus Limnocylindrales bacterium]